MSTSIPREAEAPVSVDWNPYRIADQLRAQPGVWATVRVCARRTTACGTATMFRNKTGTVAWSRPAGAFEARTYKAGDQFHVRARFVGGAE